VKQVQATAEAAKNGGPMLFARMARADFPITQNNNLSRRANQWFMSCLAFCRENFFMSNPSSELVEISKLNGDFKKNYGKLIGAYLYLRSISAARGRICLWSGLLFAIVSTVATWLEHLALSWLYVE
jgi:hypothetical protein